MKSFNHLKKISCFAFIFVLMVSFAFAADPSRSSVVSTDFYIPENVSGADDSTGSFFSGFDWVFWGIGVLIVILVVGCAYWAVKRRKNVVVPSVVVKAKKAKATKKKKKSKKSKK